MSETISIMFDENGIAKEYDDTFDITIHCESEEEQNRVLEILNREEKTGHWVNAKVGKLFPSNDYKCSECGNLLDFDGVNCGRGDANYCPNCGCHMVEPQESEYKE